MSRRNSSFDDNPSASLPPPLNAQVGRTFKSNSTKKTLRIYETLLKKSCIKNAEKHLPLVSDLYASDRYPMGDVSQTIYESIFHSRKFGRYGELITTRLSDKERMVQNLKERFSRQSGTSTASATTPSDRPPLTPSLLPNHHNETSSNNLKTPTWKIGHKPASYGPPGLAPPLPFVLNSLGNEQYFNYDGAWANGEMEGSGIYKFADGMLYTGGFMANKPCGDGEAVYSSGSVYNGSWSDGKFNGDGTCSYNLGTVYHGMWANGKRSGRGKLTFQSGSFYDGDFKNGKFDGRGFYFSKDTGIEYTGGFENGYLKFSGTVKFPDGTTKVISWPSTMRGLSIRGGLKYLEDERVSEAEGKRAQYGRMFGSIRERELQDYVDDVRADIVEGRKQDTSKAQEAKKRAVREGRERERERRLQSLIGVDGNAIEGSEEEVSLLREEVEEVKRRREDEEMAGRF